MSQVREKALGYLREGAVRVLAARPPAEGEPQRAVEVRAHVDGYTSTYIVAFNGSRWACTCPAIGDSCAHVAAVQLVTGQLVTGHPSKAAKPHRVRRAS